VHRILTRTNMNPYTRGVGTLPHMNRALNPTKEAPSHYKPLGDLVCCGERPYRSASRMPLDGGYGPGGEKAGKTSPGLRYRFAFVGGGLRSRGGRRRTRDRHARRLSQMARYNAGSTLPRPGEGHRQGRHQQLPSQERRGKSPPLGSFVSSSLCLRSEATSGHPRANGPSHVRQTAIRWHMAGCLYAHPPVRGRGCDLETW